MASDGNDADLKLRWIFPFSLTLPQRPRPWRVFGALAEGGSVTMPISKTTWSPCFGMLKDRFGLGWMVSVEA